MTSLKKIGLADLCEGLYKLKLEVSIPRVMSVSVAGPNIIPSTALWNYRLGHLSHSRLAIMNKQFPFLQTDPNLVCETCHFAKQKKLPFCISTKRAINKMDILHFDIWGPLSIMFIHGHSYFLTVVDDYSRFVRIVLLKSKSEVQIQVQNFILFAENQFECKVKIVRSDNGPEFDLQQFYSSKGILHQKSCVETPQQNGRVERKHQHILNVDRALLFQSKLPKKFWSYALVHATYIINRVSSSILKDKSPYQFFLTKILILLVLKFLVPYVLLPLFVLIELSLLLEQERVFFLAIKLV